MLLQNSAKILSYSERSGLSRFSWIQQPGHFPIAVPCKPLIVWSQEMNHQKVERVTYWDGIRRSRSFRLTKSSEFCSSNCCAAWNSFADAQNSVYPKPLVRWGCISNWWKAEKLFQRFSIQLRGRIPQEQPQKLIFLKHCNLSSIAVFSSPVIWQKVIAPKPLIGWGQVNIHSNDEKVP
jgi:hypothetical protein